MVMTYTKTSTYSMWMGFDTIVAMNRAGYSNVLFRVKQLGASITSVRYYKDFYIADAAENYTMNLTLERVNENEPENLTVGDCLSQVQNIPFSTWDNVHIKDNCPALAGAGWWFNNCSFVCNPLGVNEDVEVNPIRPPHMSVEGTVLVGNPNLNTKSVIQMYFLTKI